MDMLLTILECVLVAFGVVWIFENTLNKRCRKNNSDGDVMILRYKRGDDMLPHLQHILDEMYFSDPQQWAVESIKIGQKEIEGVVSNNLLTHVLTFTLDDRQYTLVLSDTQAKALHCYLLLKTKDKPLVGV